MNKILLPLLAILSLGKALAIDVYVVAGQSNGWRLSQLKEGTDSSSSKVHYFGMDCVKEPTASALKTLKSMNPETMGYGLAESLRTQGGVRDIVFVQYCRCGASVTQKAPNSWWPGEAPENGERFEDGLFGSFEKYLSSVRQTVEGDLGGKWEVKGLFWHQGEADVSTDKALYEKSLRSTLARFRSLLGKDIPIVAGHIRELGEGTKAVNAVLDKVASADGLMTVVPLEGAVFEADRDGAPNVHIALKGCDLIGRRMAGAMQSLRLAADVRAAGGKLITASDGSLTIELYNGNNPLKGKGGKNEAVTDEWLQKLVGLQSLKKLDLANCAITDEGLRSLRGLVSLEELNLTLTPVTDAGLAHLGGLTALRFLGMASTKCTGAGFTNLRALKKLENVNFHFTPLNDAGLKAISEVGVAGRLWFAHSKFTDAGAASLAALRELKACGIGSTEKESSGEAIAFLKGLERLEDLTLLDNQATPAGVAHASGIRSLRKLDVSYGPAVDDASLRLVATLPNLNEFKIGGSAKVTDEGVLALGAIKTLQRLTLSGLKNVTPEGMERLRKARPEMELITK